MSRQRADDAVEEEDRSEILEWFTHARKIPELIGKLPSGEQIKGGPYRPVQLVLGGIVLAGGHLSMPWWSSLGGDGLFGIGVRYLVVVFAAAGITVLAGKIPLTMINPALIAEGVARQLTRRHAVRWAGQPVTYARPHRIDPPRVVPQTARARADHTPAASENSEPTTRSSGRPRGSVEGKMADLARRNHA